METYWKMYWVGFGLMMIGWVFYGLEYPIVSTCVFVAALVMYCFAYFVSKEMLIEYE